MPEERICTITIDPKGKGMKVDLEGFHGQGCRAIVDALDSLGTRIVDVDKPELYENYAQNTLTSSH